MILIVLMVFNGDHRNLLKKLKLTHWTVSSQPGVDVMIAIFGEKLPFSQKPML
jgi:hypothetical protein